jgi:tungstate transport system substrate-binding protein
VKTQAAEKRKSARTKLLAALVLTVVLAAAGTYLYLNMQSTPKQHLIISTTTSLYETGFLDVLKVEFERRNPAINVSFISQGTGLAIETAKRGDADMILVHDAARELQFLKDGYGVNRKIVAYNFFIIVGPKEDPAKLKGLSPLDALKKIVQAGETKTAVWVSRGDDSGTHSKEKALWKLAGFDAANLRKSSWYLEAGGSMTTALKMADEKGAYTLSDMATYLNNFSRKNIGLEIIVEERGQTMLNVYSAIANNPKKTEISKSNFDASMKLIRFLASTEGQDLLDKFGREPFGKPIFSPFIKNLKSGIEPEITKTIQELAYFDGMECPPQYRYQDEGLY